MAIPQADGRRADQVVHNLAETYQITVLKDWGTGQGEQGTKAAGDNWHGGEWSLEELHILREGITGLANAIGGAERFAGNIGHITIRQVDMRYRGLASPRGIKFTASPVSIDLWTVVHELAHVWDACHRWRLSKALQAYTGGYTNWLAWLMRRAGGRFDEERRWPGCNRSGYFYGGFPPAGSDQNFNRKEDLAESVTAYVYPDVAQTKVARFNDDARYREFLYYPDYAQTRRWAFVDGLAKATILVV